MYYNLSIEPWNTPYPSRYHREFLLKGTGGKYSHATNPTSSSQ